MQILDTVYHDCISSLRRSTEKIKGIMFIIFLTNMVTSIMWLNTTRVMTANQCIGAVGFSQAEMASVSVVLH